MSASYEQGLTAKMLKQHEIRRAYDLVNGVQPLSSGRILESNHSLVEHCEGSLGLGTLIVKPHRHMTSVAGLSDQESAWFLVAARSTRSLTGPGG